MNISRRKFITILGTIVGAIGAAVYFVFNKFIDPKTQMYYTFPDPPTSSNSSLPCTPPCDGEVEETQNVVEGPFYTPETPERSVLYQAGIVGIPLVLVGRVLTTDCQPIAGAILDFWQTDGNGEYDNDGFRLRGHQFTDSEGNFRLETVKPRYYSQWGIKRCAHIHVKVQGNTTSLLTTQLFFPGEELNEKDNLYKKELEVKLLESGDGSLETRFDFVLRTV